MTIDCLYNYALQIVRKWFMITKKKHELQHVLQVKHLYGMSISMTSIVAEFDS